MKKKNLVAKHAKKRGEIKHKKKYVESFDNGGEEYNDEAGMLKTNLHTMMRACKGLHKLVGPEENLPEWAQEKIAQAKGMIVAVWDYMESQHEEGNIYTNKIDLINKSNEQGVAEGSLTTKNVAPVKARPLSMERPKGEWDPIHGKAPKKGTLKYDMWKQRVAQDKKGVAEGKAYEDKLSESLNRALRRLK